MCRFINLQSFFLTGLGYIVLLVSCAGLPPIKEYSLAREALSHAEKHRADKYYPSYYGKAVKLYRQGQSAYRDRYYGQAGDRFQEALKYAERAEDLTRIKRARSGDHGF